MPTRSTGNHPDTANVAFAPGLTIRQKGIAQMMTIVAMLIFAAGFGVAATSIYATVRPSLPKIYAALANGGTQATPPPLPPRRAPVLRVSVRPVSVGSISDQMADWRAAA